MNINTLRAHLSSEEVKDPQTLHAVLHLHRERYIFERDRGFIGPNLFGAGVVLWGGQNVSTIALSGWCASEDQGRALTVLHLLTYYRQSSQHVKVWSVGLENQLELVAKSSGLRSNGMPYSGFAVLKPISQAQERSEWSLQGKTTSGPPLATAKELAQQGHETIRGLSELVPTSLDSYPALHLLWSSDDKVVPMRVF